jgi:hypothetical protein
MDMWNIGNSLHFTNLHNAKELVNILKKEKHYYYHRLINLLSRNYIEFRLKTLEI